MTLVKTSILSFIATVIKMLSGLVINKAVAVYIGPSGLALVGQFQNFTQLVMTAAQGAINLGVTKYAAEYGKDGERIPILLSTASKVSLSSSIVVGLGVILLSKFASLHFLKSEQYTYIFVIFGFTMVLFVINNLLLSILNGLREIKTWIAINIIQSIYSLIFTTLLIVWLGFEGALIAMVTNQSVVLLIVLWLLRKHPVIKLKNFKGALNKPEAKKLMAFSVMALTSSIVVPISHLIVRNHIGETIGWKQAGYWQAIWYISVMYLMVITTALSTYFLPRLSEITDKSEIMREIINGYKIMIPIVVVISVMIYFFKDLIIGILFTKDFLPMRELFIWQLIGDVFKIASWLLGYLMVAKAMTVAYISTEVIFSVSFVTLSLILTDQYGLVGVTYAFCINYLLYLITLMFLTRSQLV